MATILVVDDSAVDRRLVGGLLQQEEDLTVRYAKNGAEALRLIERQTPDLVVTDLIMPELDGLELVKAVKKQFPLVPVILMTSKGNEEIAVKALKIGAASYTPKDVLASSLLETVQSVLSISSQKQSQARLLECMTESISRFQLNNDCALIPVLVGHLQDDAARVGLCDDADRIRVGVALDEALVNAMYHGNLELSSRLRDADYDQYIDLVQQRISTSPFCDRKIYVEARLSTTEAVFVVRDEGPGFDATTIPDPRDPTNLENLGGRGVLLMQTFMDEVSFNDKGNQVTMIKRQSLNAKSDNGCRG